MILDCYDNVKKNPHFAVTYSTWYASFLHFKRCSNLVSLIWFSLFEICKGNSSEICILALTRPGRFPCIPDPISYSIKGLYSCCKGSLPRAHSRQFRIKTNKKIDKCSNLLAMDQSDQIDNSEMSSNYIHIRNMFLYVADCCMLTSTSSTTL